MANGSRGWHGVMMFRVTEPFGDGLWLWILDEIEASAREVDAGRRGRLLLVHGAPDLALSRLISDALRRIAQRRPTPAILAGGFDVAGARGDFTASPLSRTTTSPTASFEAVGHVLSTTSAAVAVADPSGVLKAAGAIAALFGESASDAAVLKRQAPIDVRFQDPEALVVTLRDRLRGGRMLVLGLSDIDLALPLVRWRDFFLFRLLPPLLDSSRLLVIATASTSGLFDDDAATQAIVDELVDTGVAVTLTAGRYGMRETRNALGDADDGLVEDLLALSGGDGERLALRFGEWARAGLVSQRAGRWGYTIDREAAQHTAGDDVRAQLRRAFEHLGDTAALKGYDLAIRTLRVAALEGMVFTVAALARVLGEDQDVLSDWLDDYLVVDDERPDAPLEGLGFVEGASAPLYRYGFRSRMVWSVMHPVYGAPCWHASPPSRRIARRYADALAATYGPTSTEAVFRVWDLARLARSDLGEQYVRLANATAQSRDYVRLLAAEADEAGNTREPRRLVASARRIVKYLRPVAFTVSNGELLRYARLIQSLLDEAGGAPLDARLDMYSMLGFAASRGQGWVGDTARCEALAIELVKLEHPHALVERLTKLATVLLEIVHQPYEAMGVDWDQATGSHLASKLVGSMNSWSIAIRRMRRSPRPLPICSSKRTTRSSAFTRHGASTRAHTGIMPSLGLSTREATSLQPASASGARYSCSTKNRSSPATSGCSRCSA